MPPETSPFPALDPSPALPAAVWVEVLVDGPPQMAPKAASKTALKIDPKTDLKTDLKTDPNEHPGRSAQQLFTYRQPAHLEIQLGDILSIPFGNQQLGGIALGLLHQLPAELESTQLREVDAIVCRGLFPPDYWPLLQRVADYYCTPLIQVVRGALPPGLLARSQRRLRLSAQVWALKTDLLTSPWLDPAQSPFSPAGQQLFHLLLTSKTGDYSWQFIQQQVKGAAGASRELQRADLVETYLESPKPVQAKLQQAVTWLGSGVESITPRQQEVIQVLQRLGGEAWLSELVQQCRCSSSLIKALESKGYVAVAPKPVLRQEAALPLPRDQPKPLNLDQARALKAINASPGTVLLHGVTGSGKTEVYLQAIAPVLQRGQSALVLVPEIGLTPQLTDRFRARFGDAVLVYHSALSQGERYDTWRQMLGEGVSGGSPGSGWVVIGTRSAVFAPLANLGLIILDEEHDSSFKQDQPAPCYHARTVASWRSQLCGCPLVLGSATPSLESWLLARPGMDLSGDKPAGQETPSGGEKSPNALYLSLPERIQARPMPPIEVVDMRQELFEGNRSMFSRKLQMRLRQLGDRRAQAILFIQRRGHSTFVSCRSCGYVATCPHCDVSLTYHDPAPERDARQAPRYNLLRCHYCNYTAPVPETCPDCHSPYIKYFGSGTQKVEQALRQEFPELHLLRFDSDTTRTKGAHRAILDKFANGEADILLGTQMLTKGLDLPQVTLVGILAADGMLHFSDYRASERSFQTLTQVAGRCGRGDEPGRVILQTYSPTHPVVGAVVEQDYPAFAASELAFRQMLHYPPCGRLVLFKLSGLDGTAVETSASQVAAYLQSLQPPGVEVLGPIPASIAKINQRYRWQVLLKSPLEIEPVVPQMASLRSHGRQGVAITLDIDPLNLM